MPVRHADFFLSEKKLLRLLFRRRDEKNCFCRRSPRLCYSVCLCVGESCKWEEKFKGFLPSSPAPPPPDPFSTAHLIHTQIYVGTSSMYIRIYMLLYTSLWEDMLGNTIWERARERCRNVQRSEGGRDPRCMQILDVGVTVGHNR